MKTKKKTKKKNWRSENDGCVEINIKNIKTKKTLMRVRLYAKNPYIITEQFNNKNKIQIDLETTLKEQMPKKRALLGESFNLFSEPEVDFKTFYYDFCEKHALFLNIHFIDVFCHFI